MGLNYEVVIQEELLSAYQREWLWHIAVIPCLLVVYLICTPSASGCRASVVHVRQTTHVHGITIAYIWFCLLNDNIYSCYCMSAISI